MALSIRNPEAERLAREASRITGRSMTEVIIEALKDKLAGLKRDPSHEPMEKRVMRIAEQCRALPTLDTRSEADILGYSDEGLTEPWS